MPQTPLTPIQRNVAYLAMGGGLLALVVTAVWFNSKGFSWSVQLIFNWHPVLMVAAWLGAAVHAALAYRVLPFTHDTSKAVHGALHVLTLILWSTALAAVVKSHNDRTPPLQNFYSLHSWFGLATIIAWSLNFIGGIATFVWPGAEQATRAKVVPRHALLGTAAVTVFACITVLLGIMEYTTFSNLSKTGSYLDTELYALHFVGFLALVVAASVVYVLRGVQLLPPTAVTGTEEQQEPLTGETA